MQAFRGKSRGYLPPGFKKDFTLFFKLFHGLYLVLHDPILADFITLSYDVHFFNMVKDAIELSERSARYRPSYCVHQKWGRGKGQGQQSSDRGAGAEKACVIYTHVGGSCYILTYMV